VLRIPLHIERVLLVNDCVIIPDFGGFILRRHPAVHKNRDCAFFPARKEIVFNPTLTYNDGLLAESYMEVYGMDFNDAQQAIRQDLQALQAALDDEGTLTLGTIGTFQRNNDGTPFFHPAEHSSIYGIGSYGLPIFYMAPLAAEPFSDAPVKTTALPTSTPVRPLVSAAMKERLPAVLRIAGQTAAVAAAACAFYFSLSTPVKEMDNTAYTAGFVPSELLHDPSSSESSVASSAPQTEEKTAAPKAAAEVKKYNLIIASLENTEAAEQFISELSPSERRQVALLPGKKGKVRVQAGAYTDRKEAEVALAKWRKKQKFQSAWLMITH